MESGYSPFSHWLLKVAVDCQRLHRHQHRRQSRHRCPTCRITGPPLDFLDQRFAFQPLSQRSPWDSYFEKRCFKASESPEGPKNSAGLKTNKTRLYPCSQILKFGDVLKNLFLVHSGELLRALGVTPRTVAHQPLKGGRAQSHLET